MEEKSQATDDDIILEDCINIFTEIRGMKIVEFKNKFDQLLDRSQMQSILEDEIFKYKDKIRELNEQKLLTQNAKVRVRQNHMLDSKLKDKFSVTNKNLNQNK